MSKVNELCNLVSGLFIDEGLLDSELCVRTDYATWRIGRRRRCEPADELLEIVN